LLRTLKAKKRMTQTTIAQTTMSMKNRNQRTTYGVEGTTIITSQNSGYPYLTAPTNPSGVLLINPVRSVITTPPITANARIIPPRNFLTKN